MKTAIIACAVVAFASALRTSAQTPIEFQATTQHYAANINGLHAWAANLQGSAHDESIVASQLTIKITNAHMKALALHQNAFHGDWNYELHPRQS